MTQAIVLTWTARLILSAMAGLVGYGLFWDAYRWWHDRNWEKRLREIQREFDAAVAEQQAEHEAREREQLKRLAAILDFDDYRHAHGLPSQRVH